MTREEAAEIAGFMCSLAILAERPKFLRELVLREYGVGGKSRARHLPLSHVGDLPEDDFFGDWEY